LRRRQTCSVVLAADIRDQTTVMSHVQAEQNRAAADLAILNIAAAAVTGVKQH
jgi:hypothetical protein